jgi:hypothetical protein
VLQINYSINVFGRTRCAGLRRGSPTGGAHPEQRAAEKWPCEQLLGRSQSQGRCRKKSAIHLQGPAFYSAPPCWNARAQNHRHDALAIKFTLAVSLLAASAIGWVYWLIAATCRKQTRCRIARRYDNNKASNNCGRVIAINLVLGAWNQSFLETGLCT